MLDTLLRVGVPIDAEHGLVFLHGVVRVRHRKGVRWTIRVRRQLTFQRVTRTYSVQRFPYMFLLKAFKGNRARHIIRFSSYLVRRLITSVTPSITMLGVRGQSVTLRFAFYYFYFLVEGFSGFYEGL